MPALFNKKELHLYIAKRLQLNKLSYVGRRFLKKQMDELKNGKIHEQDFNHQGSG